MSRLTLDTYLPYRLSMASNKVSALIAKAYETRFGLSVPQWRILVVLSEGTAPYQKDTPQKGLSQKGLIERTAMDKVTISRAVGTLVARGLLLKNNGSGDRRIDVLTLSDAGLAIVCEVTPLALQFEADLIASIGAQSALDLADILRKLEACADAL